MTIQNIKDYIINKNLRICPYPYQVQIPILISESDFLYLIKEIDKFFENIPNEYCLIKPGESKSLIIQVNPSYTANIRPSKNVVNGQMLISY